jgi:hypothetical protein
MQQPMQQPGQQPAAPGGSTAFIPMMVDLSTVQEAPDYPVYETGPYFLAVEGITVGTTQTTGATRVSVRAQILSGPGMEQKHNGKPIFDGYNLDEKGHPYWKKFLTAIGVTDADLQRWYASGGGIPENELIGRQFCALVTQREWQGNMQNNLKKHRPAGEWATFSQGAAGAGNGQQAAPNPGRLQPPPAAAAPPPMQQPPMQQGYQQPPMQQMAPPQQPMGQMPPQQPQMPPQQPQGAPPPPAAQFQQPGQVAPQQGMGLPTAPPPPGQVPGQQ